LPQHFFDELRHFFEEYKKLENKSVLVEDFGDKAKALEIISTALTFYQETFITEE
jgi:inorganic pyrophosphatase